MYRSEFLNVALDELNLQAMRASGPGGQKVNKTSSAIHLRWDIRQSRLPENVKEKLLRQRDSRISSDGELIIKAQRHRSQDKNRDDALQRLEDFLRAGLLCQKVRVDTKPTRSSVRRRLDNKGKKSQLKRLRSRVKSSEF